MRLIIFFSKNSTTIKINNMDKTNDSNNDVQVDGDTIFTNYYSKKDLCNIFQSSVRDLNNIFLRHEFHLRHENQIRDFSFNFCSEYYMFIGGFDAFKKRLSDENLTKFDVPLLWQRLYELHNQVASRAAFLLKKSDKKEDPVSHYSTLEPYVHKKFPNYFNRTTINGLRYVSAAKRLKDISLRRVNKRYYEEIMEPTEITELQQTTLNNSYYTIRDISNIANEPITVPSESETDVLETTNVSNIDGSENREIHIIKHQRIGSMINPVEENEILQMRQENIGETKLVTDISLMPGIGTKRFKLSRTPLHLVSNSSQNNMCAMENLSPPQIRHYQTPVQILNQVILNSTNVSAETSFEFDTNVSENVTANMLGKSPNQGLELFETPSSCLTKKSSICKSNDHIAYNENLKKVKSVVDQCENNTLPQDYYPHEPTFKDAMTCTIDDMQGTVEPDTSHEPDKSKFIEKKIAAAIVEKSFDQVMDGFFKLWHEYKEGQIRNISVPLYENCNQHK